MSPNTERGQGKQQYILQLKYCQKLDFEADPINKFKTLIIKAFFPISTSFQFPCITQLKYCQKLNFEADPINNNKNIFSDFNIISIPLYNAIKILPKIEFRSGPY